MYHWYHYITYPQTIQQNKNFVELRGGEILIRSVNLCFTDLILSFAKDSSYGFTYIIYLNQLQALRSFNFFLTNFRRNNTSFKS